MEDLITRMKARHMRAARHKQEALARDEAACLSLISFARAHELAFARSSASDAELQHLRNCQHCASRIRAFERAEHPSLERLLKVTLGLFGEMDREPLTGHLESCTS